MAAFESIEDALSAFATLTDKDLVALRKSAGARLGGTGYTEPADLIYEALTRCLDGRRRWPVGVPFPVFLANAMRSIASSERQARGARLAIHESDFPSGSSEDALDWLGGHAPSAEDEAIAAEGARSARARAEELRAALRADPMARAVVDGWLSDLEPNEVMRERELTAQQYKAARQRVSRKAALVARRYQ